MRSYGGDVSRLVDVCRQVTLSFFNVIVPFCPSQYFCSERAWEAYSGQFLT